MIPINLFDHCNNVPHTDRCSGTHGKASKIFEYVYDGSGLFDIFTKHWFDKANRYGHTDLKIGWLLEAKTISPGWYNILKERKNFYFEEIGFNRIYTYDQELLDLDDRFFKMCPGNGFWIKEPKLYEKTKLLSMINSNKNMCPGHKVRKNIMEKWKPHLDLFGTGINPIEFKEEGLCDYMFSIVCENEIQKNSVSEKILDCFACGTVPIYLGHLESVKELGFNLNGIIPYNDDLSVKDLDEKLYISMENEIKENLERVKKFEVLIDYTFGDIINVKK